MEKEDIDYVKLCAEQEADKAYICLEELLNTLRLLRYENTERYKTLSAAFVELSIIVQHGIEVFEHNNDENSEKDWWG